MGFYSIENGYSKQRRWRSRTIIAVVLFATSGFIYLKLNTPKGVANLSQPASAVATHDSAKITAPLPWPDYGQTAYGVSGNGVLASSTDSNQPVPVASLAKVITALAVLKKKPLNVGEQGPMITLTQQDADLYTQYIAKNGAVVPVQPGTQISQLQAMEAMLMPSANNMADTLAIWAFGSLDQYNAYANKMLQDMGISNTIVNDASGFSAATRSTAHDMVQLGLAYMQSPVLRQIASQTEAEIPFAGIIRNYNSLANKDGIIGLKVGNTDEAGRCYLVAHVRDSSVVSVVAVIGAPHLEAAMKDAFGVIGSGDKAYDQLSSAAH